LEEVELYIVNSTAQITEKKNSGFGPQKKIFVDDVVIKI